MTDNHSGHLVLRSWLRDIPVLLIIFGAAILVFALFGCTKSEARERHHHFHRVNYDANGNEMIVAHPSGCAWRQFCGCGVSVRVFGHPVRDLFLASNWRKFRSAFAAAGMVAWRYGHVFYIEAVNGDGTVRAYDPNSGNHLTRIHNVSLRGFHVVDPRSRTARL